MFQWHLLHSDRTGRNLSIPREEGGGFVYISSFISWNGRRLLGISATVPCMNVQAEDHHAFFGAKMPLIFSAETINSCQGCPTKY